MEWMGGFGVGVLDSGCGGLRGCLPLDEQRCGCTRGGTY